MLLYSITSYGQSNFRTGQQLVEGARGYINGQADYSSITFTAYVVGVIDAWQDISEVSGKRAYCLPPEITIGQVSDVSAKFIIQHSEFWHLAGSSLVLAAIVKTFPCPQ